jgi:hypothetical protein
VPHGDQGVIGLFGQLQHLLRNDPMPAAVYWVLSQTPANPTNSVAFRF